MMRGVFLVRGDAILWRHEFRHAGDEPDFANLPFLSHSKDDRNPGRGVSLC